MGGSGGGAGLCEGEGLKGLRGELWGGGLWVGLRGGGGKWSVREGGYGEVWGGGNGMGGFGGGAGL